MVDIFDEVDEELRAERAKVLFRRFGPLMVAAGLLVIAGVAGWRGWDWWVSRQDRDAAAAYLNATFIADQSRPGAASPARARDMFADAARGAPDRYAVLAKLRGAALTADAGDLPGAAALWDEVAASGAADPILRDLASLSSVQRQLDAGDPGLLQSRLKLLSEGGGAFHALALEAQALLQIRTGQADRAREALRQLARDPATPEGVRERAGGLLARVQG